MSAKPADILISFDTTGSMYPCLTQVRKDVEKTVTQLFADLPDLRIAIITHGDYCDGGRAINILDFTTNQKKIIDFVKAAPATSGGDAPECYELVLAEARNLSWDDKRAKAFVLIGDDEPHPTTDYQNKRRLDWKTEARVLDGKGIAIYAVQALGRRHSEYFYEELAAISGTPKLELAQFAQSTQLLEAICYKQSDKLPEFEALLRAKATSTVDISLLNNLDRLAGRKVASKAAKRSDGLIPVHPSRFQILRVDSKIPIKDFVQENGLAFKTGRGFYELSKPVLIQSYKEIVLVDRKTGEMFSGDGARKLAGIPIGTNANVKPVALKDYKVFCQSTSNNRALLPNTDFMYEISDFS